MVNNIKTLKSVGKDGGDGGGGGGGGAGFLYVIDMSSMCPWRWSRHVCLSSRDRAGLGTCD